MSDRLNQLEHTILELGTEIYRLRQDIRQHSDFQQQFFGIMKGLKIILDEKGLINSEDFEAAVELGAAVEEINQHFDLSSDMELERLKKATH